MIARNIKHHKMTEADGKDYHEKVMSRIITTTDIAEAHDCDLIIEVYNYSWIYIYIWYIDVNPLFMYSTSYFIGDCRRYGYEIEIL